MKKALVFLLCVASMALTGCGDTSPVSSAPPAVTETTTATTTAVTTTAESTATTTSVTATAATTTGAATATTLAAPTAAASLTTTATTFTTTTATTTTTTTAYEATVNGKGYRVGDEFSYTVMVKTAEKYGTVKIGVRYVQKGLTVPGGLAMQQNQAVMKNIGISRVGTAPEDTVGQNGFAMTVNKGYAIDTARPGYAGLLWHYETTDYDYDNRVEKRIDCSAGVALFTIRLKVTKPGEYLLDCMEYAASPRGDLTVWGEFTA